MAESTLADQIRSAQRNVASWPAWMRADNFINPDCLNDEKPCAPNSEGECVACDRFSKPSPEDKAEINAILDEWNAEPVFAVSYDRHGMTFRSVCQCKSCGEHHLPGLGRLCGQ